MMTSSRTYLSLRTTSARKYPIGYASSTTATETVSDIRTDFQNSPR